MNQRIIALLVLALVLFTACSPIKTSTDQPDLPSGPYCLPYSPEGQSIYDAKWTGEYPKIESLAGDFETVTFGLGCFWGPAAKFAVLDGVLRTRVGYTGGDTTTPSYENLGNHIEVIEVDYDPTVISYEGLIEAYFNLYDASVRPYSHRVKSVIYFRTENEKQIANRVKTAVSQQLNKPLFTEVDPMPVFYIAEAYHQLSYLKKETSLYSEISQMFPDENVQLLSVLASKLNGFIAGYGTLEALENVLEQSSLSSESLKRMHEIRAND